MPTALLPPGDGRTRMEPVLRRKRHKSSRRKRYPQTSNATPPPIRAEHPQVTGTTTTNLQVVPRSREYIKLSERPYNKLLRLRGFPDESTTTRRLRVRALNPKALWDMGRTDRLLLLKKLEEMPAVIRFDVGGEMLTDKNGDTANLATVLILSVARRGGEHSELVGELIGLSGPGTVQKIKKYMRPSLARLGMIVPLAHATARHITQPRKHNGGLIGSERVFRDVPHIIATCLDRLDKKKVKWLQSSILRLVTEWGEDDHDRGIRVGLVLVGIKVWLHRAIEGGHFGRAVLLAKVVFGGLSGVPGFGWVFSTTLPFVETTIMHRQKTRRQKFEAVWDQILGTVRVAIDDLPGRRTAEGEGRYREYETYLRRVLDYQLPL